MREERWKEEIIDFLTGVYLQESLYLEINVGEEEKTMDGETEEDVENIQEEPEDSDLEKYCFLCGKKKVCRSNQNYIEKKICDECYTTRIIREKEATEIVERCFRNLYPMYGISKWKDIRVRLKPDKRINYQFPWCDGTVIYKRKRRKDQLCIIKNLPAEAAETAITKVLLEHYIMIRSMVPFRDAKKPDDGADRKYAGLIIWCTIHYLYIVKGKELAKRYATVLSGKNVESYKRCCEWLGEALDGKHIHIDEAISQVK